MDVAYSNWLSVSPAPPIRSKRIFGATALVPTSMPTWHMMPMKERRMIGEPSILRQSTKPEALPSIGSSSIRVMPSHNVATIPMMKNKRKRIRQLSPKTGAVVVAPHAAISGAMNEAMALTNCPKVSVEAKWPLTSIVTNGLIDVCMMALPMPRSENDIYISQSWLSLVGIKLSKRGRNTAKVVTTIESSTVFLRPILFINMPVGTEKIRNQKNTSDGKKLAAESESPKSSCMLLDTAPTRSTNPIVKNAIITGMSVSLLEFELLICV